MLPKFRTEQVISDTSIENVRDGKFGTERTIVVFTPRDLDEELLQAIEQKSQAAAKEQDILDKKSRFGERIESADEKVLE